MSPPTPSRHDATARQFLQAAVQLIDAYLDDQPSNQRPARLRAIRFPAALDWLRIEDVIRLAAAPAGTSGTSRKAFFNRWPAREEFLCDAVVYALVDDDTPEDPKEHAKHMPADATTAESFSEAVLRISDELLRSLRRHPRSYLTMHIGPLLPQHPRLWNALLPSMRQGTEVWATGYTSLLIDLGLVLRPEWTPQRLAMALQATLDGFLFRYRVQPDDYLPADCEGASTFAETVLAIILGVLDADRSGQTGTAVLDELVARSGPASPAAPASAPGNSRV
jgi:hypothetical protein